MILSVVVQCTVRSGRYSTNRWYQENIYIDGDDDDRYVCIDIMISCMYSIYSFIQSSSLSFLAAMITHGESFNAVISVLYISVSSFIIIINTIIIHYYFNRVQLHLL